MHRAANVVAAMMVVKEPTRLLSLRYLQTILMVQLSREFGVGSELIPESLPNRFDARTHLISAGPEPGAIPGSDIACGIFTRCKKAVLGITLRLAGSQHGRCAMICTRTPSGLVPYAPRLPLHRLSPPGYGPRRLVTLSSRPLSPTTSSQPTLSPRPTRHLSRRPPALYPWITDAYHAVYVGAPLHYYELTSISKTHKGWRRSSVLKKGDVSIA